MAREPIKRRAGQTAQEMALQMAEAREGNPLYSRQQYPEISAQLKREALTAAINQQQELLARAQERGRVDLNDIDQVKAATHEYLESCKAAGVVPSMLGLAPAMGHSRSGVYRYISRHNTETAQFLDSLRSSWAAIVQQMGMTRACSEPVSIFILKNAGQGMTDRLDISAQTAPPDEERQMTREELEQWFLEDSNGREIL